MEWRSRRAVWPTRAGGASGAGRCAQSCRLGAGPAPSRDLGRSRSTDRRRSRADRGGGELLLTHMLRCRGGGGVHLSGGSGGVGQASTGCSLPVATTLMGKGSATKRIPCRSASSAISWGRQPNPADAALVEKADVILFVGARTNQNGTDSWALFPSGAHYIHIDIDSAEVGRNYESLRLVGDAKLTLEALTTNGRDATRRGRQPDPGESAKMIAKAVANGGSTIRTHRDENNSRPIRPERLMADIDRVLTPETIMVADASYSSIWIANYLTARAAGQRFLTPRGMADWMGPALGDRRAIRAPPPGHMRQR